MFGRLVLKAVIHRPQHFLLGVGALLLAASLVSGLSNLSLGLRAQVGQELEAYGANLMLRPRPAVAQDPAPSLDEGVLTALNQSPLTEALVGFAPYLYSVVTANGQQAAAAGTDFQRVAQLSPWWRVSGAWPQAEDQALLGISLAQRLGLAPGDEVSLVASSPAAAPRRLRIVGLVETGAAEDGLILMPLAALQGLVGQPGRLSMVQVRVRGDVTEAARLLEERLPQAQARPQAQIAQAESEVLFRVERLMALVTILVVAAAAITVLSTMAAIVFERSQEIGLMRALGAGSRRISALLATQGILMALLAGLLGYPLGQLLIQSLGQAVFGRGLSWQPASLAASLGVALALVLVAGLWPLSRALSIDPVRVLRGE